MGSPWDRGHHRRTYASLGRWGATTWHRATWPSFSPTITEPALAPGAEAYRASVARALSYYEGSEKRYLISTPQQGLTGRLNVCTREEIVDSSGNKIEAGPMTIYEIEGDRIVGG